MVCLGVLCLVTSQAHSNDGIEVSVSIYHNIENCSVEQSVEEFSQQVIDRIGDICAVVAEQVKRNVEQRTEQRDLIIEHEAQKKLQAFVDACNEQATAAGKNITFALDPEQMSIAVQCQDAEDNPAYWQSVTQIVQEAVTEVI